MPEGSLFEQIQTLQGAVSGVVGLLGAPPENGTAGSGLAGAASLAATSPNDQVAGFGTSLETQLSGVFAFDGAVALEGILDRFSTLRSATQAAPTAALNGFTQRIAQANGVFAGDFVQRLQQALDTIQGISNGIPENRTAVVGALLDQILEVLGSLEGPEAETIRAWVQSLQELHSTLMPLIEQAQAAPDPSVIVQQVVQRSLDSILEVFGFERVKGLIDFLDEFPGNALSADMLDGVSSSLSAVSTAYGQLQGAANASYPQFRDTAVAVADALRELKEQLRPVMSVIRRIATARIFQPNALEDFLRAQMDTVLAVQVQEAQKIDDPFNALFDRIDQAIAGIDLEFVRTDVLGFFENTRTTLEAVDIASIGDFLQAQLGTVDGVVQDLQQGVTDLLAQIQAFFDGLAEQYRSVLGTIGTFQPDGTFEYNVEQDLRELLTSARLFIGGDPANPGAPSIAGALDQFQSAIDQFLSQINGLLQPVQTAIDSARTTAVSGINDFSTFLQGLNVADLMEQLRQKVQEILDALLPIDFSVVVDPVVAEIEDATEQLQSIDTESLNDLLREALKVALDVIIQIDFTVTISDPLKDEFAKVKALPQQAIDELQARYEQGLALLDALSPAKLLEALFAAFDVINEAVGSLNVATLLQPLDQLHEQHLQQPLADLKPSTLLQPVADSFQSFTSVFDDINGAAIIEPLTTQLNVLKSSVAGIDITSWVDDLLAAVAKVKQDIRAVRPSELLQPLVADFARLESELDRFKPSVLFQPAADLAAPLLQFLENVQQDLIDALFQMFQAPLQILDRLRPEALTQHIRQQIDAVLALLRGVNLPARFNQLKGQYFDLKLAVDAGGVEARAALVAHLDPERQLGEIIGTYNTLITALEGLKQNVELPDLAGLYEEVRERLLGMLPPYARELMDPEKFKRVMRLADPTRFLQELDQRFEALKNRLIPIRPQDITAELDATYETVLGLVEALDIEDSLNQVRDTITQLKGIVESIRVDFLAGDIDSAVNDLRALVDALDPAQFFPDLDAIHREVELVVQETLPSQVLAGLQPTLDQVQALVGSVDPRATLGPPLDAAWQAVQGVLDDIDFTIVLSPVVGKLDELEVQFEAELRRTETAFDQMLRAAKGALSGSGASASVGVAI